MRSGVGHCTTELRAREAVLVYTAVNHAGEVRAKRKYNVKSRLQNIVRDESTLHQFS